MDTLLTFGSGAAASREMCWLVLAAAASNLMKGFCAPSIGSKTAGGISLAILAALGGFSVVAFVVF